MAENDSVLTAARHWQGEPLALATVVSTWGSAPRPRGSHMLVHADGRFEGSVSGGCVESDILQTAAEVIAGAPFQVSATASPTTRPGRSGCPAAARSR